MVSPEVVGIGSEYFVVYFRVYIYVRPVYHYIAATAVTVVYLAQRIITCLLYTSPSPRDQRGARMPSSA